MIVVAVTGSIGTGKTTLCENLSKQTGWKIVHEAVSRNPFLPLFYKDMNRWALSSQMRFMLDKTLQFEEFSATPADFLLIDRTLEEDFFVFCTTLRDYRILMDAEFLLIKDLFRLLYRSWRRADLVIYLKDTPENCLGRILNRGYPGDNKMELGYIKRISDQYEMWSRGYLVAPYLELNPAEVDFRHTDVISSIHKSIRSILKLNAPGGPNGTKRLPE